MSKVKVGDLVCMRRRKKKGMGIVLKYCDDITAATGVNAHQTLEHMHNTQDYSQKSTFRSSALERTTNPELLEAFFQNNNTWCKKLKSRFVYIRWWARPSFYETAEIRQEYGWYPIEWVRCLHPDDRPHV